MISDPNFKYEGVIGGKTGFTKKCGRCLVSCAERDGLRLIAVTLCDIIVMLLFSYFIALNKNQRAFVNNYLLRKLHKKYGK